MGFVIWLVVGSATGWIASLFIRTSMRQPVLPYFVIGIVGALLGGWMVTPLVGVEIVRQGDWSLASVLVAMAGAVILLVLVKLIHHGSVRLANSIGARRNLPKASA